MTDTGHKHNAVFSALKISGGSPLPNGFALADVRLEKPVQIQPGQWLSATIPVALFQQTEPDKVKLILPQNAPETLQLTLQGTPLPIPTQSALLISQDLATLGGLLFAARHWQAAGLEMVATIHLPQPAPFQPMPARIWLPAMPPEALATLPLLEDWGIPNRLANPEGVPGCFEGSVLALAKYFIYHSKQAFAQILFSEQPS